ncbi:TraB/GumN family protein [Methylobacillus caricis]|uniref:TraB/GumN family protein n=1 Tax=Methylobacillus caricis TaxID=1971611 RepID=UPI001CFF623E|nr:TraB/GumN family protein [Methylobacillus caricis]MCB5187861.1 TraB/GumN family protein [Methylobacillus caricis]
MLWRLESQQGSISYLFGTIHTDDPRVTNLAEPVTKAVEESEIFLMEILPSSDTAPYFMRDTTLDKLLSQQELEKVFELADFHGIDRDMAMRMKPWLLAMVFDLPSSQSPYTLDVQLYMQAQRAGKKVQALESATEHFGALESITWEEQMLMLRSVLARSQEEKEADFERLVSAYEAGDLRKVGELDEQMTGDTLPKALWDKLRVKLLDERNVVMTQRIAIQASNHKMFIAVGAAHLPGESGLLRRLAILGFKVSPVNAAGLPLPHAD